jgi:hypothetical protein
MKLYGFPNTRSTRELVLAASTAICISVAEQAPGSGSALRE